jgi:hypothetical protein
VKDVATGNDKGQPLLLLLGRWRRHFTSTNGRFSDGIHVVVILVRCSAVANQQWFEANGAIADLEHDDFGKSDVCPKAT